MPIGADTHLFLCNRYGGPTSRFEVLGETCASICRRAGALHSMHQARHEANSYRRVELITGTRRRRRWSERRRRGSSRRARTPEANVSEVARRNGVSRGLLTVWRR